jgi:peptidylprolyl isomerase
MSTSQPSQSRDTAAANSPQFQCRHIHTGGLRCGSRALRQQEFCYYHHTTRRPKSPAEAGRQTRRLTRSGARHSSFELPNPEDRGAIQHAIGEVIRRIADDTLDPRRAGLILYGLQIAGMNLKHDRAKPLESTPAPQPVDEIVDDPTYGTIAPALEIVPPKSEFCSLLDAIDSCMRLEDENFALKQALAEANAALAAQPITLQAVATNDRQPITDNRSIPPTMYHNPIMKLTSALLILAAAPLAAQTPTTPHPAAKPGATTPVRAAAPACVKLPDLSPKIPALPGTLPCAKPLYTITTVPTVKLVYTSPLEGTELKEALGIEPTTFSLAYIDTKVGSGPLAPGHGWYKLHYTGYLVDGTKFDSSFDHPDKAPIDIDYGQHMVIPGWDTGFAGMHIGGKRRLFIPFQLAYGAQAHGPIPAKSMLIFDVELVSVSDTPPPPKTPPTPPAQPKPATPPPSGPPSGTTPPPADPSKPATVPPPADATKPAGTPPPASTTPKP